MDGQLVYNILTGPSTLDFLKHYGLMIAGNSAAGPVAYRVFNNSDANSTRYKMEPDLGMPPAGAHSFQAQNVPMQKEEKDGVTMVCIPAMGGLRLPGAGGPNIMVTGLLTACSFAYLPLPNGELKVAHIMPSTRVSGDAADSKIATSGMSLANNLAASGNFAGQSGQGMKVFGSNLYQHQREGGAFSACSIIGVRRMNGWALYAQIHTQQARNVVTAVQFYP